MTDQSMTDLQQLFIKMALDSWNSNISRASKLFDSLSDEQLQQEVSPGRNSGAYLLGHLTAIHDALFPLLGSGDKLYPRLEEIYIRNPDRSEIEKPGIGELRNSWLEVNTRLS